MFSLHLRKLFIHKSIVDLPQVAAIRSRLDVPAEVVGNAQDVYNEVSGSGDPVEAGKSILFLTENQGRFIRSCPGTRYYTCCGYKILHIGTFCTLDCSYCILQSYFHPPVLQFFVNYEDMFSELDHLFSEKRLSRIGTGEFTDSMIWESITDLSGQLVTRFARQSSSVLELKTKTVAVDGLKHLDHNRKTIVSWSLNTPRIIQTEERLTTSLSERFKASKRCESWGYPVAFHFDPMVIYDGCTEEYAAVAEQIFNYVSPENISWISLGSFRFMPSLKSTIQKRFQKSKIPYGEFISGLDGKMRYFKPLRIELYREVIARIRQSAPDVCVYFCMEDDEVWRKSMGFTPKEKGGLPTMLDQSAVRICKLESDG